MNGGAMNDEYWVKLGRRAVACSKWRWADGMLAELPNQDTVRIVLFSNSGPLTYVINYDVLIDSYGDFDEHDALPDFRDPATVGCLLALVRCSFDLTDSVIYVAPDQFEWEVRESLCGSLIAQGKTEAEALIAALEAAP
jgi:hypothetical protein